MDAQVLKPPYLVQRATAREFAPDALTGNYLRLAYMGSSEFEWGAIPKFQRDVFAKLNKVIEYTHVYKDMRLYFWLEQSQNPNEYRHFLEEMIDGNLRLKERSGFTDKEILFVGKNRTPMYDQPHAPYEYNVWFDLTNGVVIARKSEILDNLKVTIPNSVRYMDKQKGG